jgi:ubiquitin-protein ligase
MNARVLKEIKLSAQNSLFKFFLDEKGLYGKPNNAYLKFIIENGIYKGQTHILSIQFTYENYGSSYQYPKNAPEVLFKTDIYHTNVNTGDGSICVDILKDKWSPMYGIEQIFISIIALLDDPNTDSPYNPIASKSYSQMKKNDQMQEYSNIAFAYYAKSLDKHSKIMNAAEFGTF